MANSSAAATTIAIQSIGDMGSGIARLLLAHDFKVITNATDRSADTRDRARRDFIELVTSDQELCTRADYVLSIVPPKDAVATARRIAEAANQSTVKSRLTPLYYLELNALSPATIRSIAEIFSATAPHVRLIDGGIIGGPPSLQDGNWKVPRIVMSGPQRLDAAPMHGDRLAELLNARHLTDTIGSASGLKMCFASLLKGFTALAIQAYTTAFNLDVLPALRDCLEDISPGTLKMAERTLPSMPPKAYRWVKEMEEIALTFSEDGGFSSEENVFDPIARVYALVADGTELGREKTEQRERGQNADDVALMMSKGLAERKLKKD